MIKGCAKFRPILALFAAFSLTFGQGADVFAASSKPIVRKVAGGYCGAKNASAKFSPYKKSGSSYVAMKSSDKKFKILKPKCSDLISAKILSFKSLPSTGEIIAATSPSGDAGINLLSVSGTAPTLSALGTMDARQVYFLSDVITRLLAGTPTEGDCNQIMSSSVDGASGGISACRAAQNVGEGMGNILQSETTLCYMKRFPAAIAADRSIGGITRGRLPAGGWSKLFDTPEAVDRLVEVVPTGMGDGGRMFLKVRSDADNLRRGNQYRVEFYACDGGGSAPQEAQVISITTDNSYMIQGVGSHEDGELFQSTVSGKVLASGGQIEFDANAKRSAATIGVNQGDGSYRKTEIEIDNSRMITRALENRGSTHKAYSVANYSGTNMSELSFTDGAFFDAFRQDSNDFAFQGAIEYRDTGYRAAPGSSLVSLLPLDLNDEFYQNAPATPELSTFNCNTAHADITISMDMASEGMQAVAEICEGNRFESHDFCETTEMRSVQDAFFQYCTH